MLGLGESDASYFYETAEVDEDNPHPMGMQRCRVGTTTPSMLSLSSISLKARFCHLVHKCLIPVLRTSVIIRASASNASAAAFGDEPCYDDLTATVSGRLTHNNQFGNDFSLESILFS
ncbi:hypothetical protein OH492_20145 [Vibrio chagasii]|nr:hypothetical protein [Vibrio chagasii]